MSRELIYKIVKNNMPQWKDLEFTQDELIITPFKSLTNSINAVELVLPCACPKKVLVRIFADTSKVINQRKEKVVFAELANQGLGPKLYSVTDAFRIEEFLDSRMLTAFELRNRTLMKSFATVMCDFNYNSSLDSQLCKVEKKDKPFILSILDDWLQVFRAEYAMYCKKTTLPENKKLLEDMKVLLTPRFIEDFTTILPKGPAELVVAHNDIHEGNILQMSTQRTKLVLIDYEYCNYNYRGFDLSLYVTESAFDYSYPVYPYCKEYDDNRMETDEVEYLCEAYLKRYYEKYYAGTETYESFRAIELPALVDEVLRLEPLNNVMWAMWGITTIHWSELTPEKEKDLWNYGYSKTKFDIFSKLKGQFLSQH